MKKVRVTLTLETEVGSLVLYGNKKWNVLCGSKEVTTPIVILIRPEQDGEHVYTRVPQFWWKRVEVLRDENGRKVS